MTESQPAYTETGWLGSRTFELTADAVIVRAWGFAGRNKTGEARVKLADLDPQPAAHSWHRRSVQHAALLAAVVAASTLLLLAVGVSSGGQSLLWVKLVWFMFASLLAAGLFALLDPRRVEYTHFNLRSGHTGLSVGRVGADAQRYDAFVAALAAAIRVQGQPEAGSERAG
jgi:hypothetical protein